MSRISKLTPSLQKIICDRLERGHFFNTAAGMAGVSARSAQSWLARGRKEDSRIAKGASANQAEAIYLDFLLATEEATSHAVDKALQTLETEITKSAKEAKWFLTHHFPGSWGGKEENDERVKELEETLEKLEEDNNGKNP